MEGKMSTDSVKEFINEACEKKFDALVPAGEMFEAYRRWCFERGIERVGTQAFAQGLADQGIYTVRRAGGPYYEHISLVPAESPETE
jgi:phage/plasmid-associated DNA primase